jgi:hypothetical protein
LPSVQKKHSANHMALGKEPDSGSVCNLGEMISGTFLHL